MNPSNNLAQADLQLRFADLSFKKNFQLKDLTYFKVGGPAECYVEVSEKNRLADLLAYCSRVGVKTTILGGASNVVVSEAGIRGLVIKYLCDDFKVLYTKSDQSTGLVTVYAASGLKTSLLVRKTIDLELGGLEYFLGVPGSLGGAIYNNAHYLTHLISEYIDQVEIIDEDFKIVWIDKADAKFAYDSSRFHHTKEVILGANFVLPKTDPEKSRELLSKATRYRAQTQPLGLPSSGCIFRNVANDEHLRKMFPQFAEADFVPGGFLIDKAGLKGVREGDIEVSQKHAAFFVNHGSGTAEDIKRLIEKVKSVVKEKFAVELQEEVFWLE
ncbi:MAG: UDP-N-acetylmuramate dehydrogenase [Patescibacteria group bacterium]